MKWRKWNRIIHRDLGYIFFFMTVIYAVSGIAINHMNDWNPNYYVDIKYIDTEGNYQKEDLDKTKVKEILAEYDIVYRTHYFPSSRTVKVFIKGGVLNMDLESGKAKIEKTFRRPILGPMNYLHYNPHFYWTIFSDIFSVSLVLIAISGLFIIRGKKSIAGRGAWLTGVGILIPIIFLLVYFY